MVDLLYKEKAVESGVLESQKSLVAGDKNPHYFYKILAAQAVEKKLATKTAQRPVAVRAVRILGIVRIPVVVQILAAIQILAVLQILALVQTLAALQAGHKKPE